MNPYSYYLQNQYELFIANQLSTSGSHISQTPIINSDQSNADNLISPSISRLADHSKSNELKRTFDKISKDSSNLNDFARQGNSYYSTQYQQPPATITKQCINPTQGINFNLMPVAHNYGQSHKNEVSLISAYENTSSLNDKNLGNHFVHHSSSSSVGTNSQLVSNGIIKVDSSPIQSAPKAAYFPNAICQNLGPISTLQIGSHQPSFVSVQCSRTNINTSEAAKLPLNSGQTALQQVLYSQYKSDAQQEKVFLPLIYQKYSPENNAIKQQSNITNTPHLKKERHDTNNTTKLKGVHSSHKPLKYKTANKKNSDNTEDYPVDLSHNAKMTTTSNGVKALDLSVKSNSSASNSYQQPNNSAFNSWYTLANNSGASPNKTQPYPHQKSYNYTYNLLQNMANMQTYYGLPVISELKQFSTPTIIPPSSSRNPITSQCSSSNPDSISIKESLDKSVSSSFIDSSKMNKFSVTQHAQNYIAKNISSVKPEKLDRDYSMKDSSIYDFEKEFSPLFSSSPVKITKPKRVNQQSLNGSIKRKSKKISDLLMHQTTRVSSKKSPPDNEKNVIDCIIIGAGVSGLAAAQLLQRKGLRCVVLEARDRHGGRIHTISKATDDDSAKPYLLEMGANYIHGCVNDQWAQPMFVLASRLNVPTAITPGDIDKPYRGWENPEISIWRDHLTGKEIPREIICKMTLLFDSTMNRLSQIIPQLEKPAHEVPLKSIFNETKDKLLDEMCTAGARSSNKLDAVEEGVFDSLASRFISYVNPIDRLSALISENKYPDMEHDEQSENTESNIDLIAKKFTFIPSINDYTQTLSLPNRGKGRRQKDHDEKPKDIPKRVKLLLHDNWIDYYQTIWDKKWETLQKLESPSEVAAKRVHRRWEDRLVLGGYGSLTDRLAKRLDIRYKSVVTKIDYSSAVGEDVSATKFGNFIKVESCHLDQREARDTLLCQYCIVTLPVGVLKGLHPDSRVQFVPDLPESKIDAINRLGIPHLGAETHDKVILRFKEEQIFWDRNSPQLKCADSRLHVLNLDWYGQSGILLCHVWGGSGLKIFGRSDEEVVEELMTLLRGMYSQPDTLKPDWSIVTRWSEDCFTLGSYTEGEIGSSDADRHAYADSLPSNDQPKLLFAGEATIDSVGGQQCTHGAFMSGVNRACDILRHRHGSVSVPLGRIVDFLTDTNDQKKQTRRKPTHPNYHSHNNKTTAKLKSDFDASLIDLVQLDSQSSPLVCAELLNDTINPLYDVHNSSDIIKQEDETFLRQLSERCDDSSRAANTSLDSEQTIPYITESAELPPGEGPVKLETLNESLDNGKTLPAMFP